MHLAGFAATHWPSLGFIALVALGIVGVVKWDKPDKWLVRWWFTAILTLGSVIMAIAWVFIGYNIQMAELRQQARITYGVQLTDTQSERLIYGADETVTLTQEGTRATVQKVHLIQQQDTDRWLLQTRGPKHVIKVPLREELPKLG